MKKKWIMGLSAVLSLCLVLSSCSFSDKKIDDEPEKKNAMGRYSETKLELPQGISEFTPMQLEDGSYLMIGKVYNKKEDYTENYLYESVDNGKSWTELEPEWLKNLDEFAVNNLILTDKDNGFVFYSLINDEIAEQSDALWAEGKDEEAIELWSSLDKIAKLENGVLTELENFPKTSIGYNATPWESFISAGGDLIVYDPFTVVRVDTTTGEAALEYPIENNGYTMGASSVYEDKIASISSSEISIYDIEKGEIVTKLEVQQESYIDGSPPGIIARDKTDAAFYYATPRGIYRALEDGSITEKIVDNTLNSLGMPTNSMKKLFVNEDKSFLVATRGNLYSYEFDESIPTVPGLELTIYSLNENSTIRQAIGLYQNANPNIKITQEIGKKSNETVFSDALKTLSTEVLAGKGPDIFVMDGIPIKSYEEKGILLDISDIIQPKIDSGELLANIVKSSETGGKYYSVPTKFAVPFVQGVELGEINTIGDILDWYEKHSEIPLGITREDMEELYDFYSIGWFNEDGSLNEENMLKTLKDLDRLAEVVGENEAHSIRAIDNGGGVFWANNGSALVIGKIKALEELSMLSSALDKREEGELRLLPTNTGGSFVPDTILGVNAASKQAEEAKAFVEFALSLEAQEEMFYSGMPVNKAALYSNKNEPQSQWGYGGIISNSLGVADEETGETIVSEIVYELEYAWPKEKFMNDFVAQLEQLKTPVERNRVVERIINDPVYRLVVERSGAPEETAKEISKDLELYLAEQQ